METIWREGMKENLKTEVPEMFELDGETLELVAGGAGVRMDDNGKGLADRAPMSCPHAWPSRRQIPS